MTAALERDETARPAVVARLVVLAPNWLGDAVMALPAIAALRRWWPAARLTVAARRAVAPLFTFVDDVDEVLSLTGDGGWRAVATHGKDVAALAAGRYDLAVLLPNSFHAALLVRRAGIRERWGVRRDLRGPLLTRAVRRPRGAVHQAEYYRAVVRMLGGPELPLVATVRVPEAVRARARTTLEAAGWKGEPLLGFAPGAAFGPAKRWPPDRVGAVAAAAARAHGVRPVFVGTAADRPAVEQAAAAFARELPAGRLVDLAGGTDLATAAAVLAECVAVVSNDSGAMHLASAAGTPVVAVFGPTDERATSPLPNPGGGGLTPIVGEAFCRPCLLRACPLDHRCMRSVAVSQVSAAVSTVLTGRLSKKGVAS